MKPAFVFPQTISDDPNFLRAGGLTKLELVALQLLPHTWARLPATPAIILAYEIAEDFLKQGVKRQAEDFRLPFNPSE